MGARLFVALELSEEIRHAMRRRLVKIHQLAKARWVDPDKAHITLYFLGDTEEELIPPLESSLAPVFARRKAFALRLHGGGTYPQGRPARVAWVGVKAPSELAELQREVVEACASALGRPPEKKAFSAHVTVARCQPPWPRRTVERYQREAQGHWGEELLVREGVLFESVLEPRGAVYTPRARFALEPS
jgi:RNA 2',3'-cyclic 3'-phosphodiesterase